MHRPADHKTLIVFFAVLMANGNFNKFSRHTDECSRPHPKQCGRAAKEYRKGNAADIAGTHSTRQRRGQRLKVTGVTRVF